MDKYILFETENTEIYGVRSIKGSNDSIDATFSIKSDRDKVYVIKKIEFVEDGINLYDNTSNVLVEWEPVGHEVDTEDQNFKDWFNPYLFEVVDILLEKAVEYAEQVIKAMGNLNGNDAQADSIESDSK